VAQEQRLQLYSQVVSYPEHLPSFEYVGVHRYFLTFCTFERRRHFVCAELVELVRTHFAQQAEDEHFSIPAYCFMPDHVHLLTQGTQDDSDLKRFVKMAKQYSGFYFKQRTEQPLWQRYGFERVLRGEEGTWDVARYIVSNPVRARLVTDLRAYPFWGSLTHSRDELLQYIQWAA
jgi:putative transposase